MGEKTLEDHERAHTGRTDSRVRHGQDATGRSPAAKKVTQDPVYQKLNFGRDLD